MVGFELVSRCRDVQYYAQFSDDELREEIAVTKGVFRRTKAKLTRLKRKCQNDLNKLRKALAYRKLVDMISTDERVTPTFCRKLDVLISKRGLDRERVMQIVRATSKGRAESLGELTEIEAMVVWHLLGGAHE
jgi:hypothetical protein